jgi:uncharacterized peroxidase-related enzyme
MTWIKTISYNEAVGKLKTIYERIKGPGNNIDNILMAHSLRPHTLEGHMTLYKYVLHHPQNTLPKWLLEAVGVYVSLLNSCDYCIEHHYAGMKRLLAEDEKSAAIRTALELGAPQSCKQLTKPEAAALNYAALLTKAPNDITPDTLQGLRDTGFEDGAILEINQAAAYFAYANRTVLGLGVNKEGDIIGLSPGTDNDPDNWGHG